MSKESENTTATQALLIERNIISEPIPDHVKTEEDFLRWQLYQMEKRYREEAEPILNRLKNIEAAKPMKPIFVPLTPQT